MSLTKVTPLTLTHKCVTSLRAAARQTGNSHVEALCDQYLSSPDACIQSHDNVVAQQICEEINHAVDVMTLEETYKPGTKIRLLIDVAEDGGPSLQAGETGEVVSCNIDDDPPVVIRFSEGDAGFYPEEIEVYRE